MPEPMTPEERDALAAELALGLLEGDDRTRAMRLLLSDPEFAAAVDGWNLRFEPLYGQFEAQPSPELWPVIQRRLHGTDNRRMRRSLARWRIGAVASGALAASLAAILLLRPAPVEIVRAPDRAVIAQLGSSDAPALLAAAYDPARGVLRIRAVRLPGSQLAPELWVIPADGVPRSLGLVSADGVSRVDVPVPHRALLSDGATLAITLEPRDGAPHKAPSSAPIAAGKISTI
ncbi:anti-sigma factor [Sphingomonas sp. NIBR02145]|uniref:anti-sigma factor n=1 Tax=Sphingomonas sp. NIBR02145 TaxID=3014784 RepID=UPI0022B55F71|nr:anti-sigma factor [Sphingomonas sp. NIBR02145]WHU02481.1 anti-sigma factor [Sphingomonas sp. NIBR02145]